MLNAPTLLCAIINFYCFARETWCETATTKRQDRKGRNAENYVKKSAGKKLIGKCCNNNGSNYNTYL